MDTDDAMDSAQMEAARKSHERTALVPAAAVPPLPGTEFEVIARLKTVPKDVHVTVTIRTERPEPQARHWVELHYSFEGKLGGFGTWLKKISDDVDQAGGYVTGINISDASDLRPANDRPDDYSPDGKWSCMFVVVRIKPKVVAHAEQAAWDQAIRDIFARGKRGG